ncbi:MBL fold metallo-hydrolase [Paenibacillus sp. FSL H8-0048]|uniref:MBL fold metallo-hydrolase n=1 Tax=Paenibacillus sp. FSL H8-0048 TaxID=2954508 RepID=UPI0030F825B2
MKIKLIRHATLWLEYGGVTFLIDPMLSEQGVNPPIMNSGNDLRNPLVSLPGPVQQWLEPGVVLVTHLHQDHWDAAAVELLSKELPVYCQEGDGKRIAAHGFGRVTEIMDNGSASFGGVALTRTDGHHGTGEIGELMGKVSGFLFRAEGEPVLYLAGDTIWCEEVQQVIAEQAPEVIIVNAGGAQFLSGGPITMNEQDVVEVCHAAPSASVIAVHMDTINHCLVTRELLKQRLEQKGLSGRVAVPLDGEWI